MNKKTTKKTNKTNKNAKAITLDAKKPTADKVDVKRDRNTYAREYYKKHADKIREASRKSHAKRRTEVAKAAKSLKVVLDAVRGLVSETGPEAFDHFYKNGGAAMMVDFENAVKTLAR